MHYWLVKTEPGEYSADDLEREARTVWSGVSNPLAQKHLRAMHPGDEVLVYHTGDERAIVAVAKVGTQPRPDPDDPSGRTHVIDVEFLRRLPRPVPLADVKADEFFADFALVRQGRLSVMPVTPAQWKRLLALADRPAE